MQGYRQHEVLPMPFTHRDRSTCLRASRPDAARLCRPLKALAMLAALVVLAAAMSGCGTGRTNPAYEPHENLLSILADLERYTGLDLYRHRAPLDPAGTNLYRASLVRLRNYERLHPDRYRDVVAFARGRALERLDDHEQAAEAFGAVMDMDTPIAAEAAEAGGADGAGPMQTIVTPRRFLFAINLMIGLKVGSGVTLLVLTLFEDDRRRP